MNKHVKIFLFLFSFSLMVGFGLFRLSAFAAVILDTRGSFSSTSSPLVYTGGTPGSYPQSVFGIIGTSTSGYATTTLWLTAYVPYDPGDCTALSYINTSAGQQEAFATGCNILSDGEIQASATLSIAPNTVIGFKTNNTDFQEVSLLSTGLYDSGGNDISPLTFGCIATDSSSCGSYSGPTYSPSINFIYPQNGTTTAPFSNWIIQTGAVHSGNILDVIYGFSSSTLFLDSAIANNNTFSLQSPHLAQLLNFNNATSVIYDAQAFLDDGKGTFSGNGSYSGTVYASTSLISFTMVNTSTFIQSGGGLNFLTPLVLASSSQTCSSGNLISDGLCIFAVGALTPQQSAVSFLQDSENSFVAVPPFSGLFSVFSNLQSSVSSSPVGTQLNYNLDLGMASGSIPYLTSSTLAGAITTPGKVFFFQLKMRCLIFWTSV